MAELIGALELVVRTGTNAAKRYPVFDGMVLGRGSEAHLVLRDVKASRRHAIIRADSAGTRLEDLNSHNGTWLNGKRVEAEIIGHQDVIQLGESRIEVVAGASAITEAPLGIVYSARMGAPPSLETDGFLNSEGLPSSSDIASGDQLAANIALTKARHYATVVAVARGLGAGLKTDQLISRALDLLLKVIGGDAAYVVLVDEATGRTIPHSGRGRGGQDAAFEISSGVVDWVIQERTAVVSSNATEDQRFNDQRSVVLYQLGPLMAAPMLLGERVLGVVQMVDKSGGSGFSNDHLELLRVIAPVLATALENAKLMEAKERTILQMRLAQEKLIDAQRQLVERERMAALGHFSGGLAHEVRNLLTPFLLADILKEKYPEDDGLQEITSLMTEAYERIASVVEDVRQLAKGERQQSLQLIEGRFDEVISGAVRLARCDEKTRAHEVKVDLPELPRFQFDAGRMKQVMLNLIRNASDAMEEPGELEITARWAEDDKQVQVSIRDTGCGIEPDHMERIWEPFFTTKGTAGTGLGLELCRDIVEAHGGMIRCESEIGVGTTFSFALPVS